MSHVRFRAWHVTNKKEAAAAAEAVIITMPKQLRERERERERERNREREKEEKGHQWETTCFMYLPLPTILRSWVRILSTLTLERDEKEEKGHQWETTRFMYLPLPTILRFRVRMLSTIIYALPLLFIYFVDWENIFGLFKLRNYFATNNCENDPSSIQCRDPSSNLFLVSLRDYGFRRSFYISSLIQTAYLLSLNCETNENKQKWPGLANFLNLRWSLVGRSYRCTAIITSLLLASNVTTLDDFWNLITKLAQKAWWLLGYFELSQFM